MASLIGAAWISGSCPALRPCRLRLPVRLALEADFAMAFCNPRSASRLHQFASVPDLPQTRVASERLVIFARAVSPPGQGIRVVTLREARPEMADMRSLIIVGAPAARRVERFVYAPRRA